MPDSTDTFLRRQEVLADFGDFALQCEDLDEVLTEACRLVGEALGTGRAKVLEIETGGESLFIRAGVGWKPEVVGRMHIPMGEHSSESYSIEKGEPVITQDIAKEERFDVPDFMKDEGVRALANVPIFLPGKRAYGLLQVDDTAPRDFDGNDTAFLRAYASILGPVIDRLFKLYELRASEERFRFTVEAATDYAIFTMDPDGRITDWLPGAEAVFGWCAEEVVGHAVDLLFTPEDRASGQPETELETARRDGSAPDVRWHQCKDGSRVFINGMVQALHNDHGAPAGFLKIGQDITEQHASQARQAFLLRFSDALRVLDDPVALQGEAARLLREHFDAGWCYYVEWDATGTIAHVLRDSTREGLPSMVGVHDVSDAPEFTGLLRSGQVLNVADFATYPRFPPRVVARYTGIGIHSVLGPSLVKNGRLIATLSLADSTPREWSEDDIALVGEVAERTWAAVERARADAALRQSEERFRAIVETATDYAIFTTDPEGLITTWPHGAQEVFGWTVQEALGRSVDMTFTPEDRATGAPETERLTARTAGYAPDVRWHLCKDGSRVFIDGATRPLTEADGTLTGFVKVGQDVTERRATEEALRESEARFRQFGDASADVLWVRNAETLEFEYVSPAFEEVYGHKLAHILDNNHVRRWVDLIVPEDRALALDHLRRVRAGEHVLNAFRILRGDGQIRWIRDTGFPILDETGQVQRVAGIGHDATEQVELQDRLQVLVAELQHRSRNLVGVVQGVTERTLATSDTLDDFRTRIRSRLGALGRVNGLLSRLEEGDRITFDQLLETELQAHGVLGFDGQGEQVSLRGPKGIRLRSATVQTFALALHELATNALKYGALSRPEGRLEVKWSLIPGKDGERRLRVDWRESGVTVADPEGSSLNGTPVPRRQGYGRELIERALPYQLRAETSYDLTPEGVRCLIIVPVSSTLDLAFSSQREPDA